MSFLSGFVAIVGPPNVGKSTLLNRILGTKLAIVTPKPQTTRNRILGVYHGKGFQIVFMDTPGIHKTHTALHKSMVQSSFAAFQEVDIILLMIDRTYVDHPGISAILNNLRVMKKCCILAINKIDKCQKDQLLAVMAYFSKAYPFEEIIPISALKGEGVGILIEALMSRLNPGPPFFPEDMKTDQSEAFMVSEIIREKIYFHTRKELPYASAVVVEKIEEVPKKDLVSISARIFVESKSQKGILIGKRGQMIKYIGQSARTDLEKMFGLRVYLALDVGVQKDWSKDSKALRRLGY
jgi:GTP-binding protein Era